MMLCNCMSGALKCTINCARFSKCGSYGGDIINCLVSLEVLRTTYSIFS